MSPLVLEKLSNEMACYELVMDFLHLHLLLEEHSVNDLICLNEILQDADEKLIDDILLALWSQAQNEEELTEKIFEVVNSLAFMSYIIRPYEQHSVTSSKYVRYFSVPYHDIFQWS